MAYPDRGFTGQISNISRLANPTNGLFTAEITIKASGADLRPGMIAEVDLIQQSEREYSVIPVDALLELRTRHAKIFVVSENGTAREQKVSIVSIQGQEAAINEDLSEFKEVIIGGHQNLEDLAEVTVTR